MARAGGGAGAMRSGEMGSLEAAGKAQLCVAGQAGEVGRGDCRQCRSRGGQEVVERLGTMAISRDWHH